MRQEKPAAADPTSLNPSGAGASPSPRDEGAGRGPGRGAVLDNRPSSPQPSPPSEGGEGETAPDALGKRVNSGRLRWRQILIALSAAVVLVFALSELLDRQPRYQGRTVESWLLQGGDSSRNMAEAKQALDKMGREAMPYIVRALGRRNTSLRGRYLAFRARLPSGPWKVLPAPDHPQDLRWAAMHNLSTNPYTHEFIPDILNLLEDSDPEVRRAAIRLLSEMNKKLDAAALPTLRRALRDDYYGIRVCAINTVARMGTDGVKATPDLVKLLDDPVDEVRRAASSLLVGIHGPAFRTKLSTQVVAHIEYIIIDVPNR
jgi:HEAT repeat protein